MRLLMLVLAFLATLTTPAYAAQNMNMNVNMNMSEDTGMIRNIEPVSPSEITGKVDKLVGTVYESAKPLIQTASKVMLAAAGVMLIFVLVFGKTLLKKAIGTLFFVGLGLFLYINVDKVVGVYLWLANYFKF